MKYEVPKNSVIISVEEKEDVVIGLSSYDGLFIETTNGELKIVITSGQQCCEEYGSYFSTPDDLSSVLGATIYSVEEVCISSDEPSINPYCDNSDNTQEIQIRIATSKGDIQYAVYNNHNGYYSHDTIVNVFGFEDIDYL